MKESSITFECVHCGLDNIITCVNKKRQKTFDDLVYAIVHGSPIHEIKEIVFKGGVDVNDTDDDDKCALWWAISRKRPDIIHALVDIGADIEARHGQQRNSMLQCAVAHGDIRTVKALCGLGVDIDGTNYIDENALHTAILEGKVTAALFLISSGINLYQTAGGIFRERTPLDMAIKRKQITIAKAIRTALAKKPTMEGQ